MLQIDDEHLMIKIVERLNKHIIPPTPPKRNARWEPDFAMLRSPQFESFSSGKLSLQIEASAGTGSAKAGLIPRPERLRNSWLVSLTVSRQ